MGQTDRPAGPAVIGREASITYQHHHTEVKMSSIIGFPNPVNEKAARVVAGGVLVLTALSLVLSLTVSATWLWTVAVLMVGFVARVVAGPKLSVLGQFATRVVAPRFGEPTLVAGPPKRFAQAIGATVTLLATLLLALGYPVATQELLGLMIVAAGLESIFAYCIGCGIFAVLMKVGLVPEETCARCANITTSGEGA